ncbi:MAG TPA: Yip1 family protein [Rhabdochlamydiaceae bacterium]
MAEKDTHCSPWRSIWIEPRKTIRSIVRTDAKLYFWLLSWIYAFPILLHMAQNFSLGEVYSMVLIVALAVVAAPFVGWVFLSLFAVMLLWTGRWIGGQSNYMGLRAAVSWSNVPNTINIVLWALLAIQFGSVLFTQGFMQMDLEGSQLTLVAVIFLVQAVLAVWTLVILLNTVAEVQKFSVWKAVLNVVMPFVIVFIASWVLAWMVWSIHVFIQS